MYSISKDKLPDAPKKPIVEKLPIPPPTPNPQQPPIVENITQGVQTSTVIILVVLVVVIIIAIGVGIYFFIEKDKEITHLTDELNKTINEKNNRVNDITCDCPEIPKCPEIPECPAPPQCPTTICPDCPKTNDIVNSLFPGRSTLDYENTNDPGYGNKDMEILDDKDVDADNQKKYLVDQSLDIDKNYKELKKQIEGILGKSLTLESDV